MASRKAYPCFACRDKGFDNVMVLLDGKDSEGKTKYLNEDGTRHTHQGSSATQQQQSSTVRGERPQTEEPVSRESLQTQQQGQLLEILQILQGLETKIDHLTKLVYSQTLLQQKEQT